MNPELIIEFHVPRVPPTINRLSREHWGARVKAKKLWREELQVALHFGNPLAISKLRAWAECGNRMKIEMNVIHNREFDPDNLFSAAKIPLDALKSLGCIVDDSAKHIDLFVTQQLGAPMDTQFRIARLS